ncbi:acyltransferase [Chryseobacterium sp. RLHN22]|uniref:acyltransferase n=1 Tax=Chryseobacterium sp. RLHN22 TaxID=3437885 RepID=UPI003D9AB6A9
MIRLFKEYAISILEYGALILGYIPIHWLRIFYYRNFLRVKIGKNSTIHRCCQIRWGKIVIGDNVIIGENALLDGRVGLYIGNNVNFSSNVSVYSLQHDYNSPDFAAVGNPVYIKDNTWISCNTVILPGVTVHEGAVVAAMCLVNKDVPEYSVVGGVPFKIISKRNRDIQYKLKYHKPFF